MHLRQRRPRRPQRTAASYGGRAGGILSIRGPEVSLGPLRVGTGHVQTPTPRTRALPSGDTYKQFAWQCAGPPAQVPKVLDQELSGEHRARAYAVYGTTRPQTYPRGRLRADLYPQKVNNLDPMAPRPRQKRQLPEGPQES